MVVLIHLSSTSWNKQLGVWTVVKILLLGGILGAERKRSTFNRKNIYVEYTKETDNFWSVQLLHSNWY